MPYTVDSPDLPDNVKKLPDKKKKMWVAVFNSALATCLDEGGEQADCEESAFAQAWGTVNKENRLLSLVRVIRDVLGLAIADHEADEPDCNCRQAERAVSMPAIYEQVWSMIASGEAETGLGLDGYPWLVDVYTEDTQMFAILSAGGKLYRADLTLDENEHVIVGQPAEVKIEFETMARTVVRQTDLGYRWFSISCTAALNRCGEIDSTQLFDSFIEHAEETGEYPIRIFYHTDAQFRVGQVDYMARDGYVLITSGLYDQSPLAEAEIRARLENPDYWGISIGFVPTAPPELWEVQNGVNIPVYNRGIMIEESTLPEAEAAAWYTATPTVTEVNRMLGEKQFQALIHLFGGDKDKAKEWLDENVEQTNALIRANMVARQADEQEVEQPAAETEAHPVQLEPETEPVTEPAAAPEATERELVLDEETLGLLVERVMGAMDGPLATIVQQVQEVRDSIAPQIEQAARDVQSLQDSLVRLETRLAALEADETVKQETWLADRPKSPALRVTYRPRENAGPVTMADEAAATLERMPKF